MYSLRSSFQFIEDQLSRSSVIQVIINVNYCHKIDIEQFNTHNLTWFSAWLYCCSGMNSFFG